MAIKKIIDGTDTAVGTVNAMAPKPFHMSMTHKSGNTVYRTAVNREAAEKIADLLSKETPPARKEILSSIKEKLDMEKLPPFPGVEGPRMWDPEYAATGARMAISIMNELGTRWNPKEPLQIERCREPLNHALMQAFVDDRIILWRERNRVAHAGYAAKVRNKPRSGHVFLVEHDWAGAFAHATGLDDNWRLPYDECCFEFQINGRHVCVLAHESTQSASPEYGKSALLMGEDQHVRAMIFIQVKTGWLHTPPDGVFAPLASFIAGHLRAISISLEAKVAETEVKRVPFKLNAAREKRGKLPLADHRVVHLAHRRRVVPAPPGMRANDDKRTSPRLHFRRRHPRHYQNYVVTIEWQLVGDPDLGFVDKHYRL